MIEVYGDMWKYPAVFVCITTNGFIKKNGECVMGRGVAKQAKDLFGSGLAFDLGFLIKDKGNHVAIIQQTNWESNGKCLIAFPVKHNWWEKADIELIKRSADELTDLALVYRHEIFVLPRPGCGNGQLLWKDVKPIIESRFPDNVHIIERYRNANISI